jgi:Flp pilus assembly protein TadD
MKTGRHDGAIEDYSEAMRLNPKDAEAPFNRGLTYMRSTNTILPPVTSPK